MAYASSQPVTTDSLSSPLPAVKLPGGLAAPAVVAAALGLGAAVLAAAVVTGTGLAAQAGVAALSPGRARAAYVALVIHGAAGFPLAVALLRLGAQAARPALARVARVSPWLIALGSILGAIAVLAGRLPAAGTGGVLPWYASALLLAGWLGVAAVLWSALPGREPPLTIWGTFALVAACCQVAYLAMAWAAASGSSYGATLLGFSAQRGLITLGLGTSGMALAAFLLPADTLRPLFGSRAVWLGLAAWLPLLALTSVADAVPDLLPSWTARIVVAASALSVIPAVLLAVAFAGCLIGVPRAVVRDPAARFAMAGSLALLLGVCVEAARAALGDQAVALTAWNPMAALVPALAGPWLVGAAATYAVAAPSRRPRWIGPEVHLWLVVAAAVLLWAPTWPLGLVQAGSAGTWSVAALAARASVPGVFLLIVSSIVWLANLVPAGSDRQPLAPVSSVIGAAGPSRELVVGASVTTLAAVFFVALFLPLASPAVRPARSVGGAPELVERGHGVYVREGCSGCHTMRVRAAPSDASLGAALTPADHASGRRQAGLSRLGPDLAYIADREPDTAALWNALVPHRPGGWLPFEWLWPADQPTSDGGALIDYLLRSGEAR